MPLNIAMLSYHTCPLATLGGKDTGGMNVYVRELTYALGRLGVHVDVFTRSQDEHVPHVLHDLGYGNRVVHIPAGPETPRPKSELPLYLGEFSENIHRFAQEKNIKYDLIHSHYWMSGLAALDLKRDWNTPILHMYHTLGEMKNRITQNECEHEPQARLDGERKILAKVERIVAATPAEKAQLNFLYQAPAGKIVIIPPGVDISRFYPIPEDEARQVIGIPVDKCLLLFVGRIEPLKGIDTLIRAIAIMLHQGVLQECPHYLVIIGGEPEANPGDMSAEMERLQGLCKELDVQDLVIFLGKRAQETLPYYYSSAQMLIMPSHYESFGMVALEAMACGTPVVASQVGGLAYLIQDGKTGFVVPDRDPEALAAKLTLLIENPALRRQLGEASTQAAQAYAWEEIAQQVLEQYKDLLNKPAGNG
ncbi:MAG TPA: glycosyltransferase [Longilinea sp.]|nr:glycosyltransferase [Longilinea sp.]